MKKLSKFILIIFLMFTFQVKSQNNVLKNDSIVFNKKGFNSRFELTLFKTGIFKFEEKIYSCINFTSVDEKGNLISDKSKSFIKYYQGNFNIKNGRINFIISGKKRSFFLESNYNFI